MGAYITGSFFALTDKGLVREANEDSAVSCINAYGDILLVVADGMGGSQKGDFVSNFVTNYIAKAFKSRLKKFSKPKQTEKWLYKVINESNKVIYDKAQSDPDFKGMGSTLSLTVISGNNLSTAQIGDSRIYIINKDNKLEQISVDQSYVQYLENINKIDHEAAKTHPERHKITNAIGIRKECNVDLKSFEYNNETILICTDGVYNNVSDSEISSILKSKGTCEQKCIQLINFGNSNGGSDNMAVIIWEAQK